MNVERVTLEGAVVRLEPLEVRHHEQLCEVGLDPQIWRWMTVDVVSAADLRAAIDAALEEERQRRSLPFAVVERAGGRTIGMTRYMNIDRANRRLEIGWTWYGRAWQRTAVNTESKYLLLRHAFETLGALRVEFKTDSLNRPSREALLRIGASQEGIFRNHMTLLNGRIRHSAYFSIVEGEWPRVKEGLEQKLAGRPSSGVVAIDRLSDDQITDLHRLYQNEWWTRGRTLEETRRLLEGQSLVFGYCDAATRKLLAFARVITDGVYKALILDVIVHPSARGTGLGKALLDRIVSHTVLAGVAHLELYSRPELIPFYEQWGFTLPDPEFRFMRRASR